VKWVENQPKSFTQLLIETADLAFIGLAWYL